MTDEYLLGHDDDELQRLEGQARALARPTQTILTLAGIEPGMRVLDLGTGAGDVALALSDARRHVGFRRRRRPVCGRPRQGAPTDAPTGASAT